MNAQNVFVAAIDVGTFNNWGIAANCEITHEDTKLRAEWLIDSIAKNLKEKRTRVALGFESPLWIPISSDPKALLKGRQKDGNRPWSAGAGAAVTTASLAVLPWWFSAIKEQLEHPRATTDPTLWEPGVLLVWEAFVSGEGKTKTEDNQHNKDAQDVVDAFCKNLSDLHIDDNEGKVFSIAATALQFSGWEVLGNSHVPTLVVRT